MKILMRVAMGLVLLVAIAAGAGLLLPRHVTVERSVEIAAEAPTLYPMVSDFRRFNEWSPWADRDPEAVYTYEGPAAGTGSRMAWESDHPDVGSGSQEITEAVPDRLVRFALDFGDQGKAMAFLRLDPVEDGEMTRVTWGFSTDMGYNPVGRYMGLMIDDWVGADYEKGLATLKTLAEHEAQSEL